MNYILNEKEIEYVNPLKKADYESKLKQYNNAQRSWNECLAKHSDITDRFLYCKPIEPLAEPPEKPFYYKSVSDNILDKILRKEDYDYFKYTEDKFSLLSNKCGDLKFNDYNRIYVGFHPYALLVLAITLLLPLSIYICVCIEYFIKSFIKSIKKIKIKKPSRKKSYLSKKLEELNALKEQGLITEEDYNNKKNELLKDF